jgi:hypothetical protein
MATDPTVNSAPATPSSLPRQAAPAQCRQLAAAGIAALNDVYTLLPELALDLGPDELATVALLERAAPSAFISCRFTRMALEYGGCSGLPSAGSVLRHLPASFSRP